MQRAMELQSCESLIVAKRNPYRELKYEFLSGDIATYPHLAESLFLLNNFFVGINAGYRYTTHKALA